MGTGTRLRRAAKLGARASRPPVFRMRKPVGKVAALAGFMLLVICFTNCQRRPAETNDALIAAGEPDVYSATVMRFAAGGSASATTTSLVARRGDWRREQWTEAGGARAMILRPDLGKGYLLDLDHSLYVEFDYAASYAASAPSADAAKPGGADDAPLAVNADEVERDLSDAPLPVQVETRVLADQTVQGHACQVIEARAMFADGRVEVTRSRRARDLAGLPLLIEVESPGGARLTVERRDVRLDASPADFAVPAGFKKVDRLPAALR
jgi:hypothetical protein